MTSPRVPQPVPAGRPVGRPVQSSGRPVQSNTSGLNTATAMVRVNPAAYNPTPPKLRKKRERILLAGDSTVGKSYLLFQMAEAEYQKHKADPDYVMARFFLLDLDDTAPAYLDEDEGDFRHLYFENGGNVYPYYVPEFEAIAGAVQDILVNQKPTRRDWIFLDPADRFYEQTQEVVGRMPEINVDVAQAAVERAVKRQGFGAFQGEQWNIVSRVHDSILASLTQNTDANLMFITHLTDYVDVREKRQAMVLFDNVGVKPKGRPTLPEVFETVIVMWAVQHIPRDEKGNRMRGVKSYIERFIYIAKDRGRPFGVTYSMGPAFWESLKDARRANLMPSTIETPEQRHALIEAGIITEDKDDGEVGNLRPKTPDLDGIEVTAD